MAMTDEDLPALPSRTGHFLLESGLHSDSWSDLDGLFVRASRIAPSVAALAERLQVFEVEAVCGPLVGGAFLAQLVADVLGVEFYYAEPRPADASWGLFTASYTLPAGLARRAAARRVAVVDDAVSAGSSVRACTTALEACGAKVAVIGALVAYGDGAITHFAARRIPLVALAHRAFQSWTPAACPLCAEGVPLTDPRSSPPSNQGRLM